MLEAIRGGAGEELLWVACMLRYWLAFENVPGRVNIFLKRMLDSKVTDIQCAYDEDNFEEQLDVAPNADCLNEDILLWAACKTDSWQKGLSILVTFVVTKLKKTEKSK